MIEEKRFNLKKFLFGKIRRKLIFNLVFILIIIFIGLFAYQTIINNSLKKSISDHLETTAQSRTDHIKTFLHEQESQLLLLAKEPVILDFVKANPKNKNYSELYIKADKRIKEINKGIGIFDKKGIILAAQTHPVGSDNSDTPYFQSQMDKTIFVSYYDAYKDKQMFGIITQIRDENNNLLASIGFDMNPDDLFDIITDTTGLGKTGETFLGRRDENGDAVLFTPRRFESEEAALSKIDKKMLDVPITQALMKNEGLFYESVDYRGKSVLAATKYIEETDWGLVAKIDVVEALNPTQTNLKLALLTMALISLFLLFIGIYLSNTISKPIQELHQTAQQLEKGNFDARVNIKTGDELEQLGDTLNKTIEALGKTDAERKKLDHAKTEFLSITSHELRSPMTPMKAQLQMMLGGYFGKLNKKQKESVDIVLRNTTRLDNIIQDFLEISRIEAARLKFKFIKANLAEHIQRLVEEMEGFMPEKKIKIVANIDKLPTIEVDPDRAMQVLRNLINNAKKFSPNNSQIFVNAELKNNMIEFSVKDSGIGIDSENQRRIFEPFFQAEQTIYREHQGTGLGLAICKGIVESQNGRMWIESEEEKGTIFYFTLPLKPVREIKPIKVLFSEQENIEKKIREIFVEYLGPLGEQEFEKLNKQAITYETSKKYIEDLSKKRIIDQDSLEKIDKELLSLFAVKKTINVPEEIRKIYLEVLGPLGDKRFKNLGKLTANTILGDINQLEKNRILNAMEASQFRDYVMGLFRQKELGLNSNSISNDGLLEKAVPEKEISKFFGTK